MMTLRVSRDSGKTWGPTVTVSDTHPDRITAAWQPCECPRCLPEREAERQAVAREAEQWREARA
jgi:hypothetical protein